MSIPKFVGDLSAADAALLHHHGSRARRILEFGAGGSTQLFAQALAEDGSLLTLETDPAWIARTSEHLVRLGVRARVRFMLYQDFSPQAPPSPSFDLLFDDGVDELRREMALTTWPLLAPGGVFLFHDTRRERDIANVLALMAAHYNEIESVECNQRFRGTSSNLTVLRKKVAEPYLDWNLAEGLPMWRYGSGEVPDDFWG